MDTIDLIERKYVSDEHRFQPVDIATISQYFTLDVITSLAFGRNFGHTKNDADVHSYIKITEVRTSCAVEDPFRLVSGGISNLKTLCG